MELILYGTRLGRLSVGWRTEWRMAVDFRAVGFRAVGFRTGCLPFMEPPEVFGRTVGIGSLSPERFL